MTHGLEDRLNLLMRVVLTSHGSTGDIFPMIALGVALRRAGHSVRFATSAPFRREIEAAGLDHVDLPPRWTRDELAYWMGRLQHFSTPLLQLRELYRAALPHITDLIDAMDVILADADVLVSSYLFPMVRALADRHRVPFIVFAFAHNTVPSQHYPPEGLPRLSWAPTRAQQSWNRALWRLGNFAVDTVVNQTIAKQLKARGLPLVRDFFSKPAGLVLVAVSPGLMKPGFELNRRFQFVGYCRWQAPHDPEIERELEAFTAGERIPVLTFGSMVYEHPEAWMRRLAARWPRGRKLIVQSGWAGFRAPANAPHIKVLGPMSHDQLFAHASVVIHHGGAGTTASVLFAGKPHLIVPHIADQSFFADEVRRLGCGLRLKKRSWPEALTGSVDRVLADRSLIANAQRARQTLATEDGAARAIEQIEGCVRREKALQMMEEFSKGASKQMSESGVRLRLHTRKHV
ncbi:MAG: glycosyltransferase [Opitutaceae bacterium]